MSDQIAVFSERDIATRERLEDYAADAIISTAGGLHIQVAIVCDGAGGGEVGEMAARLTTRTIMDHMEISNVHNVPQLLIDSVEEANRVVFNELKGTGTSTVAMIAIDLDDKSGPYGRMYVASVGDSRVYLMREGQLVRLNIDHTLANEYVHAGQMSREEASRLENANYPTRMIGVGADIQVDIGFYVERGRGFVNSQRAFNIGRNGLVLQEGDTLFASSDGMFRTNDDGKSFITEDELLRHALDDDVERAARNIMRYAAARHPDDNTSLSLVFVPSRQRRAVRIGAGLTRTQRAGLATLILAFLMVIAFFGIQWASSESQRLVLVSTQDAIREIALALSATPTFTPSTTPTATITPTPTPTIPPTAIAGQVAFQYLRDLTTIPIFPGRRITHTDISQLIVDGENPPPNFIPANIFLQPNTIVELDTVINTAPSERLEFVLHPASDVYVNAGDFSNPGGNASLPQPVNVASRVLGAQSLDDTGLKISLSQSPDFYFESGSACIAAKQIPPDPLDASDTEKVAFTCFDGGSGDCAYHLPGDGELTQMRIGSRVLLDVDTEQWVEDGPILYEEVKTYYDTIEAMNSSPELLSCAAPYLDADDDGVLYPDDQCEFEFGSVQAFGCPDQDNDGIADTDDLCPLEPGTIEFQGCPPPTATPLPDSDGDGINDVEDSCPFDATNTCPEITQTIEAAITAGTIVAAADNSVATATPEVTTTTTETPTETTTPTVSPTPSNTLIPSSTPFASSTPIPASNTPVPTNPPPAASNTPVPASSTPATASVTPSTTSIPASETPIPASTTPVPASATPVLASATPVTPTITPIPASATPVPIPVANFSRTITGLSVKFNDTSSGSPTSWSWNFGDGSALVTSQNPTHIYSATGTYTVTLTVSSAGGSNAISKTVSVTAPPVASFNVDVTANSLSVDFTDTSTNNPTGWLWDFDDTNTDTVQSPTNVYAAAGTYNVTLDASNAGGSNQAQATVQLVQASFTYNATGLNVTFDSSGSIGSIDEYRWDFDDSDGTGDTDSSVANPSNTFSAGTHTVTLEVSNSTSGHSWVTQQTFTVADLPTADFTWSSVDLGTSFDASGSTNAASYSWSFGGGGVTPNHTFDSAGAQSVTLTVTNAAGETAQSTQTVNVLLADFTYSIINNGTGAQFADASTGPVSGYAWNFGNGGSPNDSTAQNPSNNYGSAGNFSVTLTVTATGAISTVNKTVVVPGSPPVAAISCSVADMTVSCTDESGTTGGGAPTSWSWTFGGPNGAGYSTQDASHTYLLNGSYSVSMTATNGAGSDTASTTVNVNGPPVVSFNCQVTNLSISCTNTSTNLLGDEVWLWTFGDGKGNTQTGPNATYTYTDAGSYTVTLSGVNANGDDTHQVTVTVAP